MVFDLCVIDWIAISSMVTGLMAILTMIAIFVAFRANKIAKDALAEAHKQLIETERANAIAQSGLDEIIIQRQIMQKEYEDSKKRLMAEKRVELKIMKSSSFEDYPFIEKTYKEAYELETDSDVE